MHFFKLRLFERGVLTKCFWRGFSYFYFFFYIKHHCPAATRVEGWICDGSGGNIILN